jgi:P-type Cu+ transporter
MAQATRGRFPGRGTEHDGRDDEYNGEARDGVATDPVCGMRSDSYDAVATADYQATTYYFCSEACYEAFRANPGSYAA